MNPPLCCFSVTLLPSSGDAATRQETVGTASTVCSPGMTMLGSFSSLSCADSVLPDSMHSFSFKKNPPQKIVAVKQIYLMTFGKKCTDPSINSLMYFYFQNVYVWIRLFLKMCPKTTF